MKFFYIVFLCLAFAGTSFAEGISELNLSHESTLRKGWDISGVLVGYKPWLGSVKFKHVNGDDFSTIVYQSNRKTSFLVSCKDRKGEVVDIIESTDLGNAHFSVKVPVSARSMMFEYKGAKKKIYFADKRDLQHYAVWDLKRLRRGWSFEGGINYEPWLGSVYYGQSSEGSHMVSFVKGRDGDYDITYYDSNGTEIAKNENMIEMSGWRDFSSTRSQAKSFTISWNGKSKTYQM